MSETMEREYDWNDVIEHDGMDFVLLPEGDYPFEVLSLERGRHGGSDKLPPCPKATLSIKLTAANGVKTIVQHNLFLHSKCEGILCAFFTAIGQRKHGERMTMNWNAVVGARGRCKVKIEDWRDKEGNLKQSNRIQKFYEPVEGQTTGTAWKPGAF